jgi:hypothetical protein
MLRGGGESGRGMGWRGERRDGVSGWERAQGRYTNTPRTRTHRGDEREGDRQQCDHERAHAGAERRGGGTEREVLSLGRDAGARQRPGPRVPSQRFTYGARRAGIPERLLGGGVTSLGTGWTEEGRAEGGAWGRVPCA